MAFGGLGAWGGKDPYDEDDWEDYYGFRGHTTSDSNDDDNDDKKEKEPNYEHPSCETQKYIDSNQRMEYSWCPEHGSVARFYQIE